MIPEDVQQFIQTAIPSIWTLELLLLMRRHPTPTWTAEALNRELRASSLVVAAGLTTLIAAGLVVEEQPGLYGYNPARPNLAEMIDRLAAAAADFPFAVNQLILASPDKKLRTFANAFQIRKD
jgi:hypothetical protein